MLKVVQSLMFRNKHLQSSTTVHFSAPLLSKGVSLSKMRL